MAYWDKLLEQVEDADREVMNKYPELVAKVNQTDNLLSEWENWKKKEYDPGTGYTKTALRAIEAKDAEIEALKLLQGSDMTWDEIKTNVDKLINDSLKTKEFVGKTDLDSHINNRVTVKVKNGDGTEKTIPITDYLRNMERGMEITYGETAHLANDYYREYGDMQDLPKFKMKDLWKHMQDNSIADFEKGYESFVAPLRAKKAEQAAQAREAEIRKEERQKVSQEFAMRGQAMPEDNRGVAPEMSALSRKIADRKKQEVQGPKLTPGSIGDGTAANDAYQSYLKDQAAGVKPNFPTGMIQ